MLARSLAVLSKDLILHCFFMKLIYNRALWTKSMAAGLATSAQSQQLNISLSVSLCTAFCTPYYCILFHGLILMQQSKHAAYTVAVAVFPGHLLGKNRTCLVCMSLSTQVPLSLFTFTHGIVLKTDIRVLQNRSINICISLNPSWLMWVKKGAVSLWGP